MELAEEATSHLMDQFILDASLYVDDDGLSYEFLPPGARWDSEEKRMVVQPELIDGDLEIKEDVRTMQEISKMADSICPVLQTTFDCPGNHENGKMPLLDMQQWVEWVENEEGGGGGGGEGGEWELRWEFYRKPCASRTLILARSAMPENCKRSTLTQEALRILRNTSINIPWDRKAELLSDFSLRMKLSGYPEKYRETIILSALTAPGRSCCRRTEQERSPSIGRGPGGGRRGTERKRRKRKAGIEALVAKQTISLYFAP